MSTNTKRPETTTSARRARRTTNSRAHPTLIHLPSSPLLDPFLSGLFPFSFPFPFAASSRPLALLRVSLGGRLGDALPSLLGRLWLNSLPDGRPESGPSPPTSLAHACGKTRGNSGGVLLLLGGGDVGARTARNASGLSGRGSVAYGL